MADVGDALLIAEEISSRMTRRQLIALSLVTLLVVSIVAGMSFFRDTTESSKSVDISSEEDGWRAHSVIAPIDTGINVYHDHFI